MNYQHERWPHRCLVNEAVKCEDKSDRSTGDGQAFYSKACFGRMNNDEGSCDTEGGRFDNIFT